MSSALVWQCIRKNNAFVVKKKGGDRRIWSTEAGNLMNFHTSKFSGLANSKTVGVEPEEDGKGVVVSYKTRAARNKPKTGTRSVTYNKGARKTMKSIAATTEGSFYRGDLKRAALVRASNILLSQKEKKRKVRKIKGRKARAGLA
eukprot:m.45110 g.45110  ORF g.45110 m.45110 type:complete len:145 (+) comp15113_c0_seq1:56-490(+)